MTERNPYEVLGASPDDSFEEIRRQYLLKARVLHPDRFDPVKQREEWNHANDMLRELNAAWAAVSEARKRGAAAAAAAGAGGGQSRRPAQPPPSQAEEPQPPPEAAPEKTGPSGRVLRWTELPRGVQERLRGRMRRTEKGLTFFFPQLQFPEMILRATTAALALTWLFAGSQSSRWSDYALPVFLSIVGPWQIWRMGAPVLSKLRGLPADGTLLTPLYLIRFADSELWVWNLWDLRRFERKINLGYFDYAKCHVVFPDFTWSFRVWDRLRPVQPADAARAFYDAAREAAARGDSEWFHGQDDFLELRAAGHFPEPSNVARQWLRQIAKRAVASLGLAMLCITAADRYNEYYDDRQRWELAQYVDKADGYRQYIEKGGRWARQAALALERVYQRAAESYDSTAGRAADPSAATAVREILAIARIGGEYKVTVRFDGRVDMPADLPELLGRRFGVNNVRPLGASFAPGAMQRREQAILKRIATAFGRIIPGDVLEFVSDPAGIRSGPVLSVSYSVRPLETIYYRDSEDNLGETERTYFPGVHFDWDMELRSAKSAGAYRFDLGSDPANHIQYRRTAGDDQDSLYDAMCESAFSAFGEELLRRFGLAAPDTTAPITAN